MQEFLVFVLRHLIDHPDEMVLTKLDAPKKIVFRLRLNQSDIGKVVGKHGATPGKMACGLKVVSPDGGPVSYGKACGRFFAEMLSGLTLGIGYIMVAFDDEKRALHDRICNTRVIRKAR